MLKRVQRPRLEPPQSNGFTCALTQAVAIVCKFGQRVIDLEEQLSLFVGESQKKRLFLNAGERASQGGLVAGVADQDRKA
jgi:ribosome modulation factor